MKNYINYLYCLIDLAEFGIISILKDVEKNGDWTPDLLFRFKKIEDSVCKINYVITTLTSNN